MTATAQGARAQLKAALERGMNVNFVPHGDLADYRPKRRSAVLILFGALDAVPAHAPSLDRAELPVPPELDVLLTRRGDHMRHHPGEIAFPGGGVEPDDESLAATALREAAEETNLDPSGIEVLGALPSLPLPVSDNLVTPIVGWWRLPSAVEADRTESVQVMRVPVAELLDPAARGTSVLRRGPEVYRAAAFRLEPHFGSHTVWGFTGMLLSSVFDNVGWSVPWDRSREFDVSK